LPVVQTRAMLTENEVFSFTDQVFMLSSKDDMASAACTIFNRNDHAVAFIA
jgi:hypothetical protein